MDRALQENNAQYVKDHPEEVHEAPRLPHPERHEGPKFDNPRVRNSYLKHRKIEIEASRREQRPYVNPPILFNPPTDDESDLGLLQRVTENWDEGRISDVESFDSCSATSDSDDYEEEGESC
ncbi:uncharacterized protein EV420DRAFT_1654389 [Desarmillaria tabescens]|uniref:Uncharacterized protein n=1 Tax=Armillaria tabescens TaxID=1929756 RepID=A0AA39J088_ARMTA|nr:uncharacterized protein EV420DRAFT_1654389 [Desarmillaria tabescens]KAK0433746.1 hypothetical protein EV420DRAFT_1654389 [Desarmillaria tabescens]